MKFALTQMNPVWEDKASNQAICRNLIEEASKSQADYIILPEMTLTGFTMQPELFETSDLNFFQTLAVEYGIGIIFGYIEPGKQGYLNKAAILNKRGELLLDYAKIHPFSYGEESKHYVGGSEIHTCSLSEEGESLSAGLFICYDLRFPEIFQKASKEASVIIVIANWPEARVEHWNTLLKARAIENQCYILGVNRCGTGNGLTYIESSAAYDPYGNCIARDPSKTLIFADCDASIATKYREEFPVKKDRREDLY